MIHQRLHAPTLKHTHDVRMGGCSNIPTYLHTYLHTYIQIEQDVPRILAKVYEGLTPSPTDWCTMITPQGQEIYFNKRTGEREYI